MVFKWYVVHVYSGSEKKVKETIEEQSKLKIGRNLVDFEAGKTILDIATNAVKNLEMAGEGAVVSDGYYKVGENIVLIQEGEAKSIVG